MLTSTADAYALLERIGAPRRLMTHVKLVGEAAESLIAGYDELKIPCNANLVRLGVAVHDAGKALFPEELGGPGSRHEHAGLTLMLEHGVQPEVAKCCVSHAQWDAPDTSFEELSVALADKLWKGKREPALESRVIDEAVRLAAMDKWVVFTLLDTLFERIANEGPDRLGRSV
jgi:hypothetical protein